MTAHLSIHTARAALAAALLLAPAALNAQPATTPAPSIAVEPGTRLRVHVRGAREPYVARAVRVGPDTIVVRPWDADAARVTGAFGVALADVGRLERSSGRRTHILRNGGYGMAGGLLAGGLFGAYVGATDEEGWFELSPVEGAVIFGVVLGVPSGVVGALTGLVPTERWRDIPLAAAPRAADRAPAQSLRATHAIRPRLALTRVPVRGAPAARALSVGVTVRPR